MKLSELIKKLQQIEKDVPFDSEVVEGFEHHVSSITRVYHNPPYTYIDFESDIDESEEATAPPKQST